uniref:Activator of basal transcription 1 n=1 Tax=Timema poppense TaxID=170557 RepID=A0A7R9DG50_TIMPO|nr:unnamed protein product [Timema poppensis]
MEEIEKLEVKNNRNDDIEMEETEKPKVKNNKTGILYISSIPRFMTVIKIKEIFGQFGDVGRVFLSPEINYKDKQNLLKKKKPSRKFSEGWVEFKRKRVAKQVALKLNNVRIDERKKSKFYDFIWNIKYLHGFKWVHLSERLSYERAVHQQRVRSEIARAKREASYFSQNIDKSDRIRKRVGGGAPLNESSPKDIPVYRQRETDSAIRERKKLSSAKPE